MQTSYEVCLACDRIRTELVSVFKVYGAVTSVFDDSSRIDLILPVDVWQEVV